MVETHGVVPLDEIQFLFWPQQCKGIGALQLLGQPSEAVKVQRSLPLQELDRHIAVRLDPVFWDSQLLAQRPVVLNHPVVGQGKRPLPGLAQEGMVVVIAIFIPLGGHAGVPHHYPGVSRKPLVYGMGGLWALVDVKLSPAVIGNSGGVRSPYLTSCGENGENPVSLPFGQAVAVVNQAE